VAISRVCNGRSATRYFTPVLRRLQQPFLRFSVVKSAAPRPAHKREDMTVTWEELRGNWHLLRAKVQQQWDKLSNADMDFIQGRRDELSERLRERYGFTKEQADKEILQWYGRLNA
jgi:uncharacterized protein YjbJ (UPF0337 family)